ncbi:hypothetical protein [Methylobacterium sp. 37f]|uniref:hypothetical protein n=1 Tax=Methylobacterium sp. 37f TaxID=2817058 RepID=UPI001FFC3C87|nr:hypothetical protein [Methylobacterium sp. 37f]MCK2055319.1 hypothetical protein [Methylobacterium sp. 37f]
MSSTDTIWISSLLHLNESIVAAQVRLSAQAGRIMDALEMREDITEEEGLFGAYRDKLHLLRLARDAMLSQVEE